MKGKLKSANMFSILIQGLMGIRVLSLPRDVIGYAKNDAWISMLIMYAITLVTAYAFYWTTTKYKELDAAQMHIAVFGGFLGRIFLIPIIFYIIITVGLSLRLFAYSIKIFLLDKTPVSVIIFLMLISCLYCIRKDMKTISIVLDILLPIVLISTLLPVVLPIKSADPGNLLPVLHRGIKPVILGTLQIVDPLMPCAIIAFILPYFNERKSVKKYIFWAVTVTSFIYLSIIVVCLMIFGTNEIDYLLFPTLTLTKAIQTSALVFERAESLFMISWIPITFSTILLNYIPCKLTLKVFFNVKKDNLIIYGVFPVFFIIAMLPQNIVEVTRYLKYTGTLAVGMNFIYLPFFCLMIYLKNRRKKKNETGNK